VRGIPVSSVKCIENSNMIRMVLNSNVSNRLQVISNSGCLIMSFFNVLLFRCKYLKYRDNSLYCNCL